MTPATLALAVLALVAGCTPPPCPECPKPLLSDARAPGDFHDNGDGTITDTGTGLVWEKLANDGSIHDKDDTYPWADAITRKIATLNVAPCFAGHCDWPYFPRIADAIIGNLFGAVSGAGRRAGGRPAG